MQFMLMLKGDPAANPAPTPELYAALGKLTQDMVKAGIMVQTGGMQGPSGTTNVKLAGGKVSVVDGPFAESREVTGGFAIIEVESRAKAVELAREFLDLHRQVMGPSYIMESEVRQMFPVTGFALHAGPSAG